MYNQQTYQQGNKICGMFYHHQNQLGPIPLFPGFGRDTATILVGGLNQSDHTNVMTKIHAHKTADHAIWTPLQTPEPNTTEP